MLGKFNDASGDDHYYRVETIDQPQSGQGVLERARQDADILRPERRSFALRKGSNWHLPRPPAAS